MSGTFDTLTPCGQGVLAGRGDPLVGGAVGDPRRVPPCRCRVARLSLKQLSGFGYSLHIGLRTMSITVP